VEDDRFTHFGVAPVDPHSPVPLYHQVYTQLRERLRSGQLKAGEMLPAEIELCRAYGVGRQTVRQAIARLVDEGLLERFAGRGTFVREPSDRMKFYLDRSFTQQMAEMGIQAHSKILKLTSGVIDETAPAALQRKNGAPCLHLTRLRYGDQQPIGFQTTTILTAQCPGLEQYDFNQESLYNILSTVYRLPIVEISHVVSAVAASEIHARMLQTQPGTPLLLVKTAAYLENGEPIEATISYYRADKYEFMTRHQYKECD